MFKKGFLDFGISIHALRVEGDMIVVLCLSIVADFYPRPPGGGRHQIVAVIQFVCYFYPRPPGGGRLGTGSR